MIYYLGSERLRDGLQADALDNDLWATAVRLRRIETAFRRRDAAAELARRLRTRPPDRSASIAPARHFSGPRPIWR